MVLILEEGVGAAHRHDQSVYRLHIRQRRKERMRGEFAIFVRNRYYKTIALLSLRK